jgi:hypothetical protein
MTIKELLFQEIESTPEELLEETLDFLRFLKTKQIKTQTDPKSDTQKSVQSTGRSLLEHLKTIGTWEGDDAQLCLERVYATRGKAKFEQPNPFDE